MTSGRRTIDRRRRVLYSTHQADQTTSTASSRREFERLREARRPTAAYGARVKRRLRGRWFSLVPVKRRSFSILAGVMSAVTLGLCLLHYASVTWPALVYRPEIARPMRLDVPDSFGRWFMVALLSACTGIALMTYQLRRYRLNDYLGRYRLWRLVLILLAVASVNSLVGLIDWTGSLLDLTFGKRVALTGGDWLRVVVGLGGAVVLLRMVAEMRQSRPALIAMLAVCGTLMIGQAAQWNVLDDDNMATWSLVTSVPLIASTALFIAMTGYLRMLYREVREIEDSVSLRERIVQVKQQIFTRSHQDESVESDQNSDRRKNPPNAAEDVAESPKRGWFGRRRHSENDTSPAPTAPPKADEPKVRVARSKPIPETTSAKETENTSDEVSKRRWFGMRAAKSPVQESLAEEKPVTVKREPAPKPIPVAKPQRQEKPDEEAGDDSETPMRRSGLGGWFGRKKSADPGDERITDPTSGNASPKPSNTPASLAPDDDDADDADSVDWNGMSKADRRRLKKQLRRQDRAA